MKIKLKSSLVVALMLVVVLVGCSTSPKSKVDPKEQETIEKAVSHLINPEGSLKSDKEALAALKKAVNELEKLDFREFDPKKSEVMKFTSTQIGNDMIVAMKAGCVAEIDSTKWFETFNENNIEFVLAMRSKDSESIAFTANFNKEQGQIRFMRQYGDMDYTNLVG